MRRPTVETWMWIGLAVFVVAIVWLRFVARLF